MSDSSMILPNWLVQGLIVSALMGLLKWLFPRIGQYLLKLVRPLSHRLQYRHLCEVRRISNSQALVTDQAVKTYILQAIFLLTFVVFLFSIAAGPLFLTSSGSVRAALLLVSAPVYVFEIVYLNESTLYKAVLRRRIRVEKNMVRVG